MQQLCLNENPKIANVKINQNRKRIKLWNSLPIEIRMQIKRHRLFLRKVKRYILKQQNRLLRVVIVTTLMPTNYTVAINDVGTVFYLFSSDHLHQE